LLLNDALGTAEVSVSFLAGLVSGDNLTASLVCGPNGEFIGPDGSSTQLGGATDLTWLKALRANAEIAITSGKTFRAENYRMPKTADLAVFTKAGIDVTGLNPKPGQHFELITPGEAGTFADAIKHLGAIGYRKIHIEFGSSGIAELLASGVKFTLWLSSQSEDGIRSACQQLGVEPIIECKLDDLYLSGCR
jgi:hypothetical protein